METSISQPVYLQISELLSREISAGHLLAGERIPPERQMARDMGVSVGTLRKSLADLQEKGLLERRQGSGNYVCAQGRSDSIYAFFRIELIGGGGTPTAAVLDVKKLKKPDDLIDFGTSDFAHRIRRLRYLDKIPVAVEEIWLDGSFADRLTKSELSNSLYQFYKNQLGLWIMHAEDSIGIAATPDWTPATFGPAKGAACGYVERLGWSQNNVTAEYSRTWYDTDKARYLVRIK